MKKSSLKKSTLASWGKKGRHEKKNGVQSDTKPVAETLSLLTVVTLSSNYSLHLVSH